MEAIVITQDEHWWKVQQGDKYADWLSYDEMMGVVSSLTMPKERPCLQWMRTKEQHELIKNAIEQQDNPQSALLNKKVTELNLSVRTTNICLSNGLNTVRDICRLAKTDWLKFRNGGKRSLSEIDNFLKGNGLDWGMNV